MESAWPILLFLAFVFGLILLMLICGYSGRELERSDPGTTDPLARTGEFALPRFLVRLGPDGSPVGFQPVDESLMASVEDHLRTKHGLAVQFAQSVRPAEPAEEPTPESARGEGFFDLVERFLQTEQRVARAFVSEPSVESLYGSLQPATSA